MDINAIEGLIKNIEKLGVAGGKIMADGKVDLADLPHAVALLSDVNEMIENFKNLKEAIGEIKDIDSAEAIAIVQKLYEAGKNIEEAVK